MKNMDPIAMFLEYQLPQMVARANEAKKNRLHELDVLEKKAKINKESQEYASLLKLSTDKISNLDTQIANKSKLLTDANIGFNLADNINELEKTSGKDALMNDYINKVNSSRNTDIDEYNKELDLMGALTNEINLRQSQNAELDKLLVGMQTGRSRSKEVTDLNNDGIKSMADFNLFLEKMENPYQVGSAEHAGFISMAPGEKEVLELKKSLLDIEKTEASINKINMETAEIFGKMASETNQYAVGSKKYNEGVTSEIRDFYTRLGSIESTLGGTKEGREFLSQYSFDYSTGKPDAKAMNLNTQEGVKQFLRRKNDIENNIISLVEYHIDEDFFMAEAPALNKNIKAYNNASSVSGNKQKYFNNILKELRKESVQNKLDFGGSEKSGVDLMLVQIELYDRMNSIKSDLINKNSKTQTGKGIGGLGLDLSSKPTMNQTEDNIEENQRKITNILDNQFAKRNLQEGDNAPLTVLSNIDSNPMSVVESLGFGLQTPLEVSQLFTTKEGPKPDFPVKFAQQFRDQSSPVDLQDLITSTKLPRIGETMDEMNNRIIKNLLLGLQE
tara:strand:+ start:195 stop:1874 length:1680 start_codon:yes stop_codon:yes gene_type:complete